MTPHRSRRLSRAGIALLIAIVALILLAGPAQALSFRYTTSGLLDTTTLEPVPDSNSHLIRTDHGISMVIKTSQLPPGHTFTVWWIIFNEPDACVTNPAGPIKCGEDDLLLFGGDAAGVVGYAAGNVAGANGRAAFAAHLSTGDSHRFIDTFIEEHDGLTNPLGAEVHLVVRDHGPLHPEWLPDQILTFAGGCDQSELPPPLQLGVAGDYVCADLQVALHAGQ